MTAYSTNEIKFYSAFVAQDTRDCNSWIRIPIEEISLQSCRNYWWMNISYIHPVTNEVMDFPSEKKLKTRTFPTESVHLDDFGLYLIPTLARVYTVQVMGSLDFRKELLAKAETETYRCFVLHIAMQTGVHPYFLMLALRDAAKTILDEDERYGILGNTRVITEETGDITGTFDGVGNTMRDVILSVLTYGSYIDFYSLCFLLNYIKGLIGERLKKFSFVLIQVGRCENTLHNDGQLLIFNKQSNNSAELSSNCCALVLQNGHYTSLRNNSDYPNPQDWINAKRRSREIVTVRVSQSNETVSGLFSFLQPAAFIASIATAASQWLNVGGSSSTNATNHPNDDTDDDEELLLPTQHWNCNFPNCTNQYASPCDSYSHLSCIANGAHYCDEHLSNHEDYINQCCRFQQQPLADGMENYVSQQDDQQLQQNGHKQQNPTTSDTRRTTRPSEESLSQSYDNETAIIEFIDRFARQSGFEYKIKSSKRFRWSQEKYYIIFACAKEGTHHRTYEEDPPAATANKRKYNATTKKTGCKFSITVERTLRPDGSISPFVIRKIFDTHNHDLQTNLSAFPRYTRLTTTEDKLLQDIYKSTNAAVPPRKLFEMLQSQHGETYVNMRRIEQWKRTQKVNEIRGLTEIEYFLKLLTGGAFIRNTGESIHDHTPWLSATYVDPATLQISRLAMFHKESIDMARRFPYVLLLDSTFKVVAIRGMRLSRYVWIMAW